MRRVNCRGNIGLGALVVAGALAGLLLGCSSDERRRVVVYSPHGKEMLAAFENQFEAKHPDVNIQWIDMGGQDAYDRIRTEKNNPQASVWWGGAEAAFATAAAEGLLEPFRPTWHAAVDADARDANDLWYGNFFTPEVLAYNSTSLDSANAPKDWDDLLEPEWKDRVLIRYPLLSSTMRTIYGAMILRQPSVEEGYAWLARLDQNVKTYTADPTQLYIRLARGEGDVTLWNLPDIALQKNRNGYPFDYVIPSSGTPLLTDGIAVVKGGANLDDAKLFYEFVSSDSALVQQAHEFYRIPVRQDIAKSALPEWMQRDIRRMSVDWQRLTKDGPGWMQHWDERIKGRGTEYLEMIAE